MKDRKGGLLAPYPQFLPVGRSLGGSAGIFWMGQAGGEDGLFLLALWLLLMLLLMLFSNFINIFYVGLSIGC